MKEMCVMCEKEACYYAPAKYKGGIVEEPLCEKCALIDQAIRKGK